MSIANFNIEKLIAKTKIILLIDKINYVHIEDANTSHEVWNKLKAAFQDSGLTRRHRRYVSRIVSTAHKLKEVDMPQPPEEYAPMIMGIESSGVKITCDSIKPNFYRILRNQRQAELSADCRVNAKKRVKIEKLGFVLCLQHLHMSMRKDWFGKIRNSDVKEILSQINKSSMLKELAIFQWLLKIKMVINKSSISKSNDEERWINCATAYFKKTWLRLISSCGMHAWVISTTLHNMSKGKMAKKPYRASETRSKDLLQLIHSDICGPMEETSIGGAKYFLSFVDDFSRKNKTDVPAFFEQFKARVENELGRKIKCLRTDNGTEYCNKRLTQILTASGIQHQTTVPYNPQQNAVAERMNRNIVDVRYQCHNASIDPHLRVFGSRAIAHIPDEKNVKNTKGYRLLNPNGWRVVKSRDVSFLKIFPPPLEDYFDADDDDFSDDDTLEEMFHNPTGNNEVVVLSGSVDHQYDRLSYYTVQAKLQDAPNRCDASQWREAMEIIKLWTLVDLPLELSLEMQMVFKTKRNEMGNGTTQSATDQELITKKRTLRSSLHFITHLIVRYEQMDAVTAFLQGDCLREFYGTPEGVKVNTMVKFANSTERSMIESRQVLDPCIYFHVAETQMFFIAVYVDDLLIFSNNNELKPKLKVSYRNRLVAVLVFEFQEIVREGEIFIDQSTYTAEILRNLTCQNAIPYQHLRCQHKVNKSFNLQEFKKLENIPYQEAGTRPDIAYAVNYLSKSNNNSTTHIGWQISIQTVLDFKMFGFCDADYASDPTEGDLAQLCFLQKGAISCVVNGNQTVALSTTEADVYGLCPQPSKRQNGYVNSTVIVE
ncbi:Retrovirus-related Pol polyprotein from transposon TNT 1-94 [Lucilia cuprina]|nr:Retrovirus-related Pol polyprotein from transposon TNT 1-94 [Lucilia cuprina]